jgi:hypothetical protein
MGPEEVARRKPAITIVVRADPTPSAFAHGSGLIEISTGMIEQLQTVDGIAAVMAHELAHVLLAHDESRRKTGEALGLITSLASTAAVGGETVKQAKAAKGKGQFQVQVTPAMRDRLVTGYAADAVLSDAFLPIAKARQEYEADRIAVDLLALSPFSADGQAEVLEKLAAAEAAAGARFGRASTMVAGLAAVAIVGEQAMQSDDNTGRKLGGLAAAAGIKLAMDSLGKKTSGEAKPEERVKKYLEYARVYPDGEYPLADVKAPAYVAMKTRYAALKAAPGWKSTVASAKASDQVAEAARSLRAAEIAQGSGQSAIVAAPRPFPALAAVPENPQVPGSYEARAIVAAQSGQGAVALKSLEAGAKLPRFPIQGFRSLAELHLATRNPAAAGSALQRGESSAGRDLWFLDLKVAHALVERREGDAEVLAARCLKDGSPELFQACAGRFGYPVACAPRTEPGKAAFAEARTTKQFQSAMQMQRTAAGETGAVSC